MAEIKWIKVATGLPDNRKIKQIRRLPDGDTIALMWVFLMCLAGEVNEHGLIYFTPEIPYTDEMLADEFDMDINTVRLGLQTFQKFGMIEIIDDVISLSAWEKWQSVDRLSEIREYNRLAKQKSRAKQKLLQSQNVKDKSMTSQCSQDTDIDKEEDREKDIDNTILPSGEKPSKPTKAEIDEFFEYIWSKYPVKKGKGQVSDAKKKALFDIGAEELERAIKRYLDGLKKEEWRKPQNGSTFFNSGYVDYLDSNYEPPAQSSEPQPVKDKHLSEYDRFMGELKAMYNESEE